MSGNHNGDIDRAFAIIDAAKAAGADAVKIQTYRPDTITIDHDGPGFVLQDGLWAGRRLYDLYDEGHLPWDWHEPLFAHARDVGITLFSSPFDPTAVDLLEDLGAPAYKIASPEIIDIPLIRKVARTGKPLVISTGMATLEEIDEAVTAVRDVGGSEIILLHCVSAYPAPFEDANLCKIGELSRRYDVVTGLSDHTMGILIAGAAVGQGAAAIEKHFTLSRAEGGVDSAFSIEPDELSELVEATKVVHAAIGDRSFAPLPSEEVALTNRRSLYVVEDISAGEVFTEENIRSIRPGFGLKPKYLDVVLGRRAAHDLKFGEPLVASAIEGGFEE